MQMTMEKIRIPNIDLPHPNHLEWQDIIDDDRHEFWDSEKFEELRDEIEEDVRQEVEESVTNDIYDDESEDFLDISVQNLVQDLRSIQDLVDQYDDDATPDGQNKYNFLIIFFSN